MAIKQGSHNDVDKVEVIADLLQQEQAVADQAYRQAATGLIRRYLKSRDRSKSSASMSYDTAPYLRLKLGSPPEI